MHQINAVENPAHRIDEHDFEHYETAEMWYDDADDFGEPPDDGAIVDDQSDISDYEDSLRGRKKKKVCLLGQMQSKDKKKLHQGIC